MTLKVGLLVGREWSFPPAFIEEVNRRDAGRGRRVRAARRHAHGRAVPLRRDHRPHLARGAVLPHLPQARRAAGRRRSSTIRSCGRPTTSSSSASLATKLGVASPKTVALPNKDYVPGIIHDESLRNLNYPLDWQAHRRLRRPALHPQGRARRRLEGRLRLPHAGRADSPLRRVRPADDGRAGVHRVGPVRPLPLPRPGRRAADEVRSARAAVPRRARPPVARARRSASSTTR